MFDRDFAQFEFLAQLRATCTETIGGSAINRGTNLGGAPWTHLRFGLVPDALTSGITEVLFHRVDARKDDAGKRRYYLSTRQYGAVKGKPEARAEKLRRLRLHVAAYRDACVTSASGLTFSRPARDNQGANESEVGILFFDEATNTVEAVLERFPLVHRAFVASLARTADRAVADADI
jgi:hypothetical protein